MVEKVKKYSYQAYRLLQIIFVIAPILAGLDKFFEILTHWPNYLSELVPQITKLDANIFMMIVGVIEIIVGIGNIFKPKIFAYITAVWLLLIVINLIFLGTYWDIALRDLGLSVSAFALARLSHKFN